MNTRIRQTLVAVAFTATVIAGIAGATLRGETKETDLAATCATAAWPMIPAACLDGADSDVRYISANDTNVEIPAAKPFTELSVASILDTGFTSYR